MRFTAEELGIAKQADLCAVAERMGYTVKRIGHYHTLKEMDSIRIYERSHWCRFSRRYDKGENGGSQIDFLRVFAGMDVKEAVFWLLDFVGYRRDSMNDKAIHAEEPSASGLAAGRHSSQRSGNLQNLSPAGKKEETKKPFVLPEFAGSNAYLYRYLEHERGLPARSLTSLWGKGFYMRQRITTTLSLSGRTGTACRSLPVCGVSLIRMGRASSVTWQAMTSGTVSICIMGKAKKW